MSCAGSFSGCAYQYISILVYQYISKKNILDAEEKKNSKTKIQYSFIKENKQKTFKYILFTYCAINQNYKTKPIKHYISSI